MTRVRLLLLPVFIATAELSMTAQIGDGPIYTPNTGSAGPLRDRA